MSFRPGDLRNNKNHHLCKSNSTKFVIGLHCDLRYAYMFTVMATVQEEERELRRLDRIEPNDSVPRNLGRANGKVLLKLIKTPHVRRAPAHVGLVAATCGEADKAGENDAGEGMTNTYNSSQSSENLGLPLDLLRTYKLLRLIKLLKTKYCCVTCYLLPVTRYMRYSVTYFTVSGWVKITSSRHRSPRIF